MLRTQARPEGLAAVVYHGLLGGLNAVCRQAAAEAGAQPMPNVRVGPVSGPLSADPALVRLLADMVLFCQQEVSHVV